MTGSYARVLQIMVWAVLLDIVEEHALLEVRHGSSHLTLMKQDQSQRMVTVQETRGILYLLRQMQTMLCQLIRRLQLGPYHIIRFESQLYLQKPRHVTNLLTQSACPGIGAFYLRGRIAFRSDQRRPQRKL